MRNYHIYILLLLLTLSVHSVKAQPKCHIKHYGVADGLPQRTVMSIIQDKKGFMWFGTWDGLCRFDGYTFNSYKPSPQDNILMRSNRINMIKEDTWGNLWIQTYNSHAYRFDPVKERYVSSFAIGSKPFLASNILIMPSGKVWLISKAMGTICIPDTTQVNYTFHLENKTISSDHVTSVFEDNTGNSWVLTDNGITRLSFSTDGKIISEIFYSSDKGNNDKASFFSAYETDTEVWFGANAGKIICYNKQTHKFDLFDTGIKSDIVSIQKVYDNLLVILTSKDGFLICDSHRTTLSRYNKTSLKALPTNEMRSCYIDQNNNIWLEMNYPGVARYNMISGELQYYISSVSKEYDFLDPPPFLIAEDQNGHVWIHPRGGGFSYYDKITDTLLPFYNDPLTSLWKFSHLLHTLYIDRQNNLWFSTRSDGIEKITFSNKAFHLNDFNKVPIIFNSEIRSLLEDSNKNIWLGSKDRAIMVFNSTKVFEGYLSVDGYISKTGSPLRVMAYTFLQDSKGRIWIGTKGDGIFLLESSNGRQDTYHVKHYKNEPANSYSLSHNIIYSIHEDANKNIWIGTFGNGLNLFDEEKSQFINHHNILKGYPMDTGYQIRTINSLNNILFIGTTQGLLICQMDDNPGNPSFYNLQAKSYNEKDGLKSNDIYHVCITQGKEVYIATQGGGISHLFNFNTSAKFETYDTSNIMPFDIVLSIIEDSENKLWIVGESNLARFDTKEKHFELFSDVYSLIENFFFSDGIPLLKQNGEVILGFTNGTLSFIPENIHKENYCPYIAFINFSLLNGNLLTDWILDDGNKISLTHNNNTFSIEYAALDFVNPENISYAYKLEGFENEWIYNKNQRMVNYTNLPPGDYVFKVRSTNSSGQWIDNERSLPISIQPSFWQTKWAYMLYIVISVCILFVIFRSLFIFYRMKDKIKMEQEQTEMKTRFYTNISHELRTPLTLIVSPIEDIIEKDNISTDIRSQLQIVLKNANRMLNMVNQILDFRKIQKQKMKIKEVSFGELITDLSGNFLSAIQSKEIHLTIKNQIGADKLWVDTDNIEKLLYNLMSNAIKHTAGGKNIEINIFKKEGLVALQVKDEGKGMNKEIQNNIFTRFASFNTDKNNPSTGIGLSIVKEIADKHHAKIIVESYINKGSSFIILFQVGLNHFSNDENIEIINSSNVVNKEDKKSIIAINDEKLTDIDAKENNQLSLLIVEDDDDLRSFIKSTLSPHYKLYEAINGKEGYNVATTLLPDFILSDIMMPEMDGISFLKEIRNNRDTSHIPFILLTAKTNIYDELEGITSGADDYITKPFNVKLLKAKIENIIKQRQHFSHYLSQSQIIDILSNKPSEDKTENYQPHIIPQDEQFIRDTINIIHENIDNNELTIDDLVSETSLSRKVFYNKIKSLTGLAPVEFVRDIRIRKAGQLIQNEEYMVKEVAYMVGFSDIKYFSRCFKHVYGMTPSEYKEKFKK